MATGGGGGGAGGTPIAQASVQFVADMSAYEQALAELPAKTAKPIDAAMKALQSKMASTKLEIKNVSFEALTNADPQRAAALADELTRLTSVQNKLQSHINAVTNAARRQASAIQMEAAEAKAAAEAVKQLAQAEREAKAAKAAASKDFAALQDQAAKQAKKDAAQAAKEQAQAERELSAAVNKVTQDTLKQAMAARAAHNVSAAAARQEAEALYQQAVASRQAREATAAEVAAIVAAKARSAQGVDRGNNRMMAEATVATGSREAAYIAALDLLPVKARKKAEEATQAIETKLAGIRIAIGGAKTQADAAALRGYYDQVAMSLNHVKQNAIGAAQATAGVGPKAAAGFGAASYKLQIFAQGLDDLQYVPEMGMRPILNNLIQISPALGIVALLAEQFYRHWGDLIGIMGTGKILSESDEMDKLAKATARTADEEERLQKLKNREAAKSRIASARSETQEAQENQVTKAMGEEGVDKVRRNLVEINNERYENDPANQAAKKNLDKERGKLEDMKEAKRQAMQQGFGDDYLSKEIAAQKKRIEAAQAEMNKGIKGSAERDMAKMATDPEFLKGMNNRLAQKPGNLSRNFRDKLKAATPEGQDDAEFKANMEAVDEETGKAEMRAMERDEKDRKARKEERERLRERDRKNYRGAEDSPIGTGILGDIAQGKDVDRARVQRQIEDKMQKAGKSKAEIAMFAPGATKQLIEDMTRANAKEADEGGMSRADAAARGVAKDVSETKQRAGIANAGFVDTASAYQSLQAKLDGGADPYQKMMAEKAKEELVVQKGILNQVTKANATKKGGLVGPP